MAYSLSDGQWPSMYAGDLPPFSAAVVGLKSCATDEAQHQRCLAECAASQRGLEWVEQLSNSAGQCIGSHSKHP